MTPKPQTATATQASTNGWKDVLKDHFGDPALTPHVRYGTESEAQHPWLHSVSLPCPKDAVTVGPVYFLTESQLTRHTNLNNPYRVSGTSCIAKGLQDECEDEGRVLYPIYVESDSLKTVSEIDAMIPPLRRFVETGLNLQPEMCTWWYSGNRSVHVHTSLLVTDAERTAIKRRAEEFNESEGSGVKLDTGLYSRKRQFRLPGVKHEKTGLPKVQIETTQSHDEIVSTAATSDRNIPRSYTQLLEGTIRSHIRGLTTCNQYVARGGCRSPVSPEYGEGQTDEYINAPVTAELKEGIRNPGNSDEQAIYRSHNTKEFSPYAKTGGDNGRSVAVVQVFSGAFSRPRYGEDARLPCRFLYAIGGDGQFTKDHQYSPLLLSKADYPKVKNKEKGVFFVIIGGHSRRSRVLGVDRMEAFETAWCLEDGGRKVALDLLSSHGYEVGSSGLCEGRKSATTGSEGKSPQLQRKAEEDGIDVLSHQERVHVANRLLRLRGWEGAWDWVRCQYGPQFDSVTTHRQLRSVVEKYEDLSHINVPPEPSG